MTVRWRKIGYEPQTVQTIAHSFYFPTPGLFVQPTFNCLCELRYTRSQFSAEQQNPRSTFALAPVWQSNCTVRKFSHSLVYSFEERLLTCHPVVKPSTNHLGGAPGTVSSAKWISITQLGSLKVGSFGGKPLSSGTDITLLTRFSLADRTTGCVCLCPSKGQRRGKVSPFGDFRSNHCGILAVAWTRIQEVCWEESGVFRWYDIHLGAAIGSRSRKNESTAAEDCYQGLNILLLSLCGICYNVF